MATRDQLIAYARQVAQQNGVDPDIFVRQISQESGFSPTAHNPSGASGIAQLMPQYYPNVDPYDPYASLDAAAATMAANLKANGGDYSRALAAYNAGQGNLDRYGLQGVMSPDFAQGQTLSYVNTILGSSGGPKIQAAPEQGGQMADETTQSEYSPTEWQGIIAQHGGRIVGNTPTKTIPPRFRGGTPRPDPSAPLAITFADGKTAKVTFNGDGSVSIADPGTALKPAPAGAAPKQVGTNTRDAYITTVDKDGNATTIPNPNYQPPAQTVTAGSTDPYIISRKADGSLVSERNPNYVAPTQVGGVPIDDAIKTAQLLRDNLAMQVEQGRLTNETAAQIFTQQWSANVDGPLKLQEARLAEQVAAETASHNAQDIALRSLQYRVGPGFGADFARGNATLSGGGGKITYGPDDFTYDMPNFNQIGQQAANQVTSQLGTSWADRIGSQLTAAQGQVGSFGQAHPADKALAAISPTAAANVGAPPPNVAAIPAMAAAVPYTPPGGAAPVAAQPGPTPYVGSGMRDRG